MHSFILSAFFVSVEKDEGQQVCSAYIHAARPVFCTAVMCSSFFFGGGLEKNIVICLGFTFERPRVRAEGRS